MSGPKGYSPPPPRYSASVFEGDLAELFRSKRRLRARLDRLSDATVEAAEFGIQLDVRKRARALADDVERATRPFTLGLAGTFGQRTYDDARSSLRRESSAVAQVASALDRVESELEGYREDAEAYRRYRARVRDLESRLGHERDGVLSFYESRLSDEPDLVALAQSTVGGLDVTLEPTPFHIGFAGTQTATRALDAAALDVEERLREARDTVADEALARSVDAAPPSPSVSPEVESLVQSVNDELADAPSDVAAAVRKRLATLQESTVARSPSFYRDLLADLRRGTLRHTLRRRLDAVANAIRAADVHIDVQAPLARTEALVARLRESGSDNERHVAEAEAEAKRLLAQSAAHHEEDAVREEEVRFVKSQIVESLSDLGYQVMGDLQVLDLERGADVLLQVPRQGNYVNLRFREDGQFVYNFLIPEDPDALSRDDRRRKVAEMDSACDAFLSVLDELRDYGLDVDQTAHREASESVLMTVPDRLRDRVQETATRKRRHDEAERQRLRLDSPDAR